MSDMQRRSETVLPTRSAGEFRLIVYSDLPETTLGVALVKGEVAGAAPVPDRRRIRLRALRLRRTT
jgi:GTP cyclohydrolase II